MDTAELVRRAGTGDQTAWRDLVDRHAGLVWRIARAHRLDDADAADVSQSTWIALAEHLPTLRSPERLSAWLATTARRECLRMIADRGREVRASEWSDVVDHEGEHRWPETATLRGERDDTLWRAFAALPDRCRSLLGLLAFAPDLSYAQLGRAVGIAVGSIGQTRGRCLDALRRKLIALGLPGEVA
ncbi:RNA polymerase sigma factor, sigma-70 family [Actinokineospora alba]|uniref:RNA polymerase sigma factor, sigma-70 family n=1 Tax=Actinokineospora alba TaxID=504798 RepID=A0A1H0PE36_9PSEU|nr:sigma-70 family RNA polymerase sigma factor [Actinokineospora alba]TDP65763.1 RNA polymerase sigma factor (sigma-70 family) [Actinokineospora alba]SDI65719.1 RNA polymerase sigma factor, sigma-70 family [Actinokineospora alba]SDP03387.1 RNA polymerase sigma factor, sigma-70 family [Actinokineospora alba]